MIKQPPATGKREPAPPASPADLVVQRLYAGQRVHGMYPRNNPNVGVALAKIREALAVFPPGEGVELDVERDQLKYGGEPVLAQQAEVREFANRLYVSHVSAIVLEPETTDEELLALFDLLRLKPEERDSVGPLDQALSARGAKHVYLREAGRVKVVESEEDPDSWDLGTIAELEELEHRVFGQVGRTGFKEVLRAVTKSRNLRATRMLGMLERPAEFAQYLVELASHIRPGDRIDLNAQLSMLEALVAKMEPAIDHLADADRIRLYLRLDEVTAWLATGIHKAMFSAAPPPFVRLAEVAQLFPDRVRDLDVAEVFSLSPPPGAAIAPLLLAGLRRMAAGDGELAAFLSRGLPPPELPDLKALASYRPAALPAGSPDAPPLALPPDYLVPRASGPSAAMCDALGRALAGANPALDLPETLVDLLALGGEPAEDTELLRRLADLLVTALEARNPRVAAGVLQALHAERARAAQDPARAQVVEGEIGRCGEADPMRAYVAMLADATLGSEEHRLCVELVRGLGWNAVVSLIDLLAAEPAQSTRRKLLDVLVAVGPAHVPLISSYATHPQWYVVRNVVWILGHLGPDAVQGIVACAAHREPRVRKEAVRSLAKMATPAALRALLAYLEDKDESVVREAVGRLAAVRAPAATAALNALAAAPRFVDFDYQTIYAVARTLTAVGNADSARALDVLSEGKVLKGWLRSPDVKKTLKEAAAAVRARLQAPAPGGPA